MQVILAPQRQMEEVFDANRCHMARFGFVCVREMSVCVTESDTDRQTESPSQSLFNTQCIRGRGLL